MERGLYAAAAGMSSAQQWLDVISHNLANISTNGFKRDVIAFNDGLLRQMQDPSSGNQVGLLGAGAAAKGQHTVFETGTISATGNDLDLALTSDSGMFAIRSGSGTRYTRDGSFALNTDRQLVTKSGELVLDTRGEPITLPTGKVVIGTDGTIQVNNKEIAQIGIWEGQFFKSGDGLFASSGARPADLGSVRVQQGALETSNVNAIEEMIAMIRLNRAFELAQKSAQSQDESTQRLIQSLQDQ